MKRIIWRNRASAILGFLVMVVPFLGVPDFIRTTLIVLLGFSIMVFGLVRSYPETYQLKNQPTPKENKGGDQREGADDLSAKKEKLTNDSD